LSIIFLASQFFRLIVEHEHSRVHNPHEFKLRAFSVPDPVMVFDGAAEAELEGNGFAGVELPLTSGNRDFKHNFGIDGRRRLGGLHGCNPNDQRECLE
jgi:hypothetical protein